MSDALQLILNGLVQAIVQHPSFKDALKDALDGTDEQGVLQNLAQGVVILETRNQPKTDNEDIHARLDSLEVSMGELNDKVDKAESWSAWGFERRLADLENTDLEAQLRECQIDADSIVGLDAAIEAVVERVKITLVVEPE